MKINSENIILVKIQQKAQHNDIKYNNFFPHITIKNNSKKDLFQNDVTYFTIFLIFNCN
jgi:hypothetical protein